ncbi:MAG: hypothetical protein ACO3TU_01565 [Burkholderiaceae bacterium]|jgi:D-sedoheptulose 7-phosphate isomerase
MLTQRVQQRVVDHADWLYQHAPTVAQRLPELVQMATSVITTGGRLWCLGDGPAAALAMYGADILRHGFERDRPGLAVQTLPPPGGDGPRLAATLRTLLGSDDMILLLGTGVDDAMLAQAVEVARQQELQLAVLLAGPAPRLQQTLLDTDWCVALPATRSGQAHLLLLMALQGLADGLDLQLLGNDSAEGETA